jgi:hypothetical protein
MGFIKDSPPPIDAACPLRVSKLTVGLGCQSQTCSAHAVSHDFSGLLHAAPRRFVAPCCRPWGSPCFPPDLPESRPCVPRRRTTLRSFSLHDCRDTVTTTEVVFTSAPFPHVVVPGLPKTPLSCCHDLERPFLRSLDLRALSRHRVRCETAMLPPLPARGSLGLSS